MLLSRRGVKRCHRGGRLRGVSKTVMDEVEHVLIGQGVEDMFAVAFAMDDVIGAKNPEPLRDGRDGFSFHDGEVANTEGTLSEPSH